ncbi:MAG TPA: T9SS type A sorting domain-containing protein, partial [Bacteroidota bacterium]|nr:T9SS type A sorting domain-containing protein [Bacteroidota bacterium]
AIATAAAYAAPTGSASAVQRLDEQTPHGFQLEQNFPNPFNPSTTLRFSIPDERTVELRIVDVLGREVAVLVRKQMQPGSYSVEWNASALPSGMYVAVLRAWSLNGKQGRVFIETKKLLMQK